MSRDMKPRKSQPARKKAAGGTLIGMFIGLVLGIAVAAGVVFYLNKSPLPFSKQVQTQAAQAESKAVPANGAPAQPPLALPGKPGDPIPEKRFQFYDILPGKADAVPDKVASPDTKKEESKKEDKPAEPMEVKKEEPKESKVPLFLQAGSFSTAQDADNQKAKLAMMGAEATIQQVMLQDKVWYRVRLGPFKKAEEVNAMRSDLAKQGGEANVVKKD